MCIPLSDEELNALMNTLDKDKTKSISFEEFYEWYQSEAYRQKSNRFFKSAGLQINKFLR